MENIDDVVIETALNLLSKQERNGSSCPHITSYEVYAQLPAQHARYVSKIDVELILDDEFSKKYNGKQVVYFLKLK